MVGKTHYAGGFFTMLVAFDALSSKGLLSSDCNELLQLLVMCPFASFGSVFSDLDHGENSIPTKTPVARFINKALSLLGARHRSWQTHCLLITGGLCALAMLFTVYGQGIPWLPFGQMDWVLLRLIVFGFTCGLASHLVLDSITPRGIHLIPGVKLSLVPDWEFFSTGNTWERIVYVLLSLGIVLLILKIFVWNYLSSATFFQDMVGYLLRI